VADGIGRTNLVIIRFASSAPAMRETDHRGGDRPTARRLAGARSSYLRSAAEQAIDWHPWGTEPFELAERLHRPVLLDIGAGWCHWCHVMDERTYSDPEVVRLIRENFIAVKVDRDENPEVDRRYQRQVGTLTGEGGWPLTGFLAPSGEAFLGGTYFPPEDGHGRPGFRRVLAEVARLWRDEPETIQQNLSQLHAAFERMRSSAAVPGASLGATPFLSRVRTSIEAMYDPANGGFGSAPKFPHPTAVSFLTWLSFAAGEEGPATQARETLRRMADGGMYDHVGGGFHRYSVDEGWQIPHFEKMGVDNAALLAAYVEGARRFGEPRFVETVEGTLRWLHDTLEDPSGGFGASQDADNAPGDDGRYFTWSRSELRAALSGEELRLATRFFGIGTGGRMPHDPEQNVLFRMLPVSDLARALSMPEAEARRWLTSALAKLRAARAERPAPSVDRARYANINGPMIAALSRAARLLDDPMALASARRAADAFLSGGFDPLRGVAHRLDPDGASGYGLLEDNAGFAWGLVELAGTTADPRYMAAARQTLDLLTTAFLSENGLLRDIAPSLYDGPSLGPVREPSYPLEDTPHISGNALTALALLRASSATNDPHRLDQARALLDAMRPRLDGAGLFAAGCALASGLLDTPPARIVVEGSGPEAQALLRAAEGAWHPDLWVFRGTPPQPFSLPEELAAAAGDRDARPARALLCFGTRCLAPVTAASEIPEALRQAPRSGR
jgi:hypothetical protein